MPNAIPERIGTRSPGRATYERSVSSASSDGTWCRFRLVAAAGAHEASPEPMRRSNRAPSSAGRYTGRSRPPPASRPPAPSAPRPVRVRRSRSGSGGPRARRPRSRSRAGRSGGWTGRAAIQVELARQRPGRARAAERGHQDPGARRVRHGPAEPVHDVKARSNGQHPLNYTASG